MCGVWIPQGLNFPWDQLLWTGVLWPGNQAAACLWGVVCLANPIGYNSNLVAVVKSLRKRCNLQAKGTWRKYSNYSWHSPGLKARIWFIFLNKIYKVPRLICTQWLWLQCNQESRNMALIKPGIVQGCNAEWRRSNGYHALKGHLIARRSFG